VAGVMGAKRTPDLIPMCHPIAITGVDFDFTIDDAASTITIRASVRTIGRTGVEMEALTAISTAALTIYDMCKAIDKGMIISDIALVKKSGGKSGLYERKT
jgi:cyclic pyranopterin phosphate synthase